jgi:alpha-1,2-mannosyltransferase
MKPAKTDPDISCSSIRQRDLTSNAPHGYAPPPKAAQDRITVRCLVLLIVILAYLPLVALRIRSADQASTDFYNFYQSARYFIQGKGIYTPTADHPSEEMLRTLTNKGQESARTLHPNLNSPLHTLTIVPFALLPYKLAFLAWSTFSLAAGLVAVTLIGEYVIDEPSRIVKYLGMWILLLAYFPSFANIGLGQYGFIVLLFLVLLWLSARTGMRLPSGIVLGLAMCLKSFFGLYCIYFATRRQWRILATASVTYIVANLFGLAIFGADSYYQHIRLHGYIPLYLSASWNASLAGFCSRVFGGGSSLSLVSAPQIGKALVYLGCTLVTGIMIWGFWKNQQDSSVAVFDRGFALTTIAMLIISPYAWIYYFPCLIVPMVVFWRAAAFERNLFMRRAVLVAIWFLSSLPSASLQSESIQINTPKVVLWGAAAYFYALAGFYGIASTWPAERSRPIGASLLTGESDSSIGAPKLGSKDRIVE